MANSIIEIASGFRSASTAHGKYKNIKIFLGIAIIIVAIIGIIIGAHQTNKNKN